MGVFTRKQPVGAPKVQPFSVYRPLTAAAASVNINDKRSIEQINRRRSKSMWQEDAWEYFDVVGEIKYAFRLFSNVMSRVRLYAAYVEHEDATPLPLTDVDLDDAVRQAANKAMRRVFAGAAQAELLRKGALNMLVAGECYLVQLPPKIGVRDKEQWRIVSIDELVTKSGKYRIKTCRDQRESEMEELPASSFVGRIWAEHPRYSDEADSSMRAIIDVCDEFFLYSRAARASARSRLNAGALFVPDSLSVSSDEPTVVEDDSDDPALAQAVEDSDDEFERELLDAMTTPISDEGSAASVVPLLIRGPADAGDKIKFIKFERSFDPQIAQRAERALERILEGIDLPKDIVKGLASVKYSNAIQIEESLYTQHVEPLVLLLCDAFRQVYLTPALKAANVPDDVIEKIVIWYDPAAIMTAPDKSNAANVGFDKYALSWDAWRRANGFADTDAPDEQEIAQRLGIARGQLNDTVTEALLRTIMPEVLDQARAQSIAQSPSPLPQNVQDLLGPKPPDDPTNPGASAPPQPAPGTNDTTQPPPIVPGT